MAGFCVADGLSCGRRSTQSHLAAARVGAAGPRLAFVWQALCVNVVPGSRDRRRRENLCLMSAWHAVLAAYCVSTSFGVWWGAWFPVDAVVAAAVGVAGVALGDIDLYFAW